jgi:hypothetical protein
MINEENNSQQTKPKTDVDARYNVVGVPEGQNKTADTKIFVTNEETLNKRSWEVLNKKYKQEETQKEKNERIQKEVLESVEK